MELIIDYYQFLARYKEKLKTIDKEVSFIEALVIYSISINKDTQNKIVDYLKKDRSQIHRVLKKLAKRRLITKKQERHLLTSSGKEVSKQIKENNENLCNALSQEIDLEDLQGMLKQMKNAPLK